MHNKNPKSINFRGMVVAIITIFVRGEQLLYLIVLIEYLCTGRQLSEMNIAI